MSDDVQDTRCRPEWILDTAKNVDANSKGTIETAYRIMFGDFYQLLYSGCS